MEESVCFTQKDIYELDYSPIKENYRNINPQYNKKKSK